MRTLGIAFIVLLSGLLIVPAVLALHQTTGDITATFYPTLGPVKLNVPANCVNGERKCANNALIMCRNREWKLIEQCDANELCDGRRGCHYVTRAMREEGIQLAKPIPANCPRWRPYSIAPPGCPHDLSAPYVRR
jgi:hypothetical protein